MKTHPSRPAHVAAMRHATLIWLLLLLATTLSWWLVEKHQLQAFFASMTVLVLAALKVRLVFLHFMELQAAPLRWRLAFEAWVVLFFGIILLGYCL